MTQTVPNGELVADRFRIVRFIAEGGMGEVYEAEDTVLGDRVALKFLSRRSIGDERVMRRFRREIQLARKVTHRNVCRLHDLAMHTPTSGVLAGREVAFVTMELLEGETLEDHLLRQGPIVEEEALPLILQMAEALSAAHAAGVIHRDFKSSNVMLVQDQAALDTAGEPGLRAVVTDFGLARPTVRDPHDTRTPLTGETRIVGTADYMSPEQLYGEDVTPASDVYALGVVIFEMMTGKKPYEASSPMSLLAKRVSQPPASPRDFVPELDENFTAVILDCLKNDPAERLSTPRDVIVALTGEEPGFVSQASGVVRVPTGALRPPVETPPPKRRRSGWIAAGVVLAALAGFAFLGRLGNRPSPVALANFNPVQLTTSAGLEIDPTFSPDGNALAYSSDQGGSFEIYVRDLTPGGREIQLTDDGGQNFEPAWSPDGTAIAFHSKERGGIWLIPVPGTSTDNRQAVGPKPLTRFGSRPAWSPDGQTLAFQSESSPQVSDTTVPALALSTLWLVSPDGSDRRQLTRAGQPAGGHAAPAFSPDGDRIVFSTSAQREKSEIWSIRTSGEDLIMMSREPAAFDPTYAADGHSIYFSARSREVNALWQLPISRRGGKPSGPAVQIKNLGLASIRQLATSVDGSKMAYAAMKTVSNLWTLPIDPVSGEPTGAAAPLTHGTGRNNRPAFSPDGEKIAFDRWQHGLNLAVWTMDSDGSNMRQLTVGGGSQTQANWFPSGNRLGFKSTEDDQRSFAAIDLGTGQKETLATLDANIDWARLAPDGRSLAFHAREQGLGVNLWLLDLADGSRRQLTYAEDFMGFPCWSPDGQWLAFQRKEAESSHLMVISAAGGEPIRLTSEAGHNWPFSFSPDSERIAFAALRDGEWNLWWVSRLTGEQKRLTGSPRLGTYVRYPTWSPNGERIVYELAETAGDIWLISDQP